MACSGFAVANPDATPAAWLGGWIWAVSTFVPMAMLPMTFPSGRVRDHRISGVVVAAGVVLACTGLATTDSIEVTPDLEVHNPIGLNVSDGLFLSGSVLIMLMAIYAVVLLLRRLSGSTGLVRRQFALVAVASVITFAGLTASPLIPQWGAVIQLMVTPLLPAAVVIAILQYRLYDLEIVIRRSLVFSGLTLLVGGGYVLIVQAAANLFDRRAEGIGSIIAAGAIALAFQPTRVMMQQAVGRWVYGDRSTPHRALLDVMHQLSAAAEPATAVQAATERLRSSLRVPWVEISSDDGPIAHDGVRPAWAEDPLLLSVDLVHLGTRHGAIQVSPRTPHEPLAAGDLTLLNQLAEPIAAVVATGRLIADLQHSRERVVIAREEERRRVRRDLHDGLGPLLSAMGTHAEVAQMRLSRGDSSAAGVLDRIRSLSTEALADLRTVIDDLQPVSTDELGLMGSIHALCATLSGTGEVHVRATGTPITATSAAVELAIYRIVAEATTNALRHGRADNVEVTVLDSDSHLTVEVADDGCGFGGTPGSGLGLLSMRERAEELGGEFDISEMPRGVRVRASFPLRPAV